jgi:hypothetical protein
VDRTDLSFAGNRTSHGDPSLKALLRTLLMHVGCGWSLRETAVQANSVSVVEVAMLFGIEFDLPIIVQSGRDATV